MKLTLKQYLVIYLIELIFLGVGSFYVFTDDIIFGFIFFNIGVFLGGLLLGSEYKD